ncbi:hypothetical protein ADL19_14755 [Streptomyces purpurogeneiscleroticus]|nr:hypothetical protein ADL19_14755 [Streptomyces purpurogeneiscleroticus]
MRLKGDAFLPQYEKESKKRYDTRLNSTFAVNKLREAVDAASAKPFKSLVGITNNTDPDLDFWIKNIDLAGNNLHLFAHQMFNDAMLVGQGHILVDHPTTANFANLGDQLAAGVRPFFKFIRDESLLAAYDQMVAGEIQTVHARVADQRTVLADDFTEQVINQIFVMEVEPGATQGIVQLYEQAASSGGDSWDFMGETPLTLSRVPLVTLRAGEREAGEALDRGEAPAHFSLLEAGVRLTQAEVDGVRWAYDNSSFLVDGIEHAHHGFRGVNGSKGTVQGFARTGRKLSIGDKHSPEINEGVYVAGALALQMGYNKGPSSWGVACIVQYPDGNRSIITLQRGRWRADKPRISIRPTRVA